MRTFTIVLAVALALVEYGLSQTPERQRRAELEAQCRAQPCKAPMQATLFDTGDRPSVCVCLLPQDLGW